ncbi:3,4-dihydroxy-2-butanone-4-phosphate synthase [Actinomadura macrotermitis]|uniref:3,4-dihydroxy-2-butanone 4-phosphate synthase n=1 Tax=Actinomadura macrotermitis TaxID=2585200 RepID=A0A7K0C3Z8_9ACTN|nr:3,4-dihydroxy-2-butanone-4-phosphate synthase [Actinomadura macrotermitis]MQY08153.1 Riboflavin biosynthesis protein RibBA [Actinomadura macrotermitis]
MNDNDPWERFSAIEQALSDLADGRPILVLDAETRENEGDLVASAALVTDEILDFMVRYTSGYLCAPMPDEVCRRLDLPEMVEDNEDPKGTAYRVSADAREGVTTGISGADRARTLRLLADPSSGPADFIRPGHVLPLRAKNGGVLERAGHTEATVDLLRLAGLEPVGVIGEVVSQRSTGDMARLEELRDFAGRHGLTLVTIADLIAYRRSGRPAQPRI